MEKKEFLANIPVSTLSLIDKSCQPYFEEPEPPKPKEMVTFFLNGKVHKVLEDKLAPKISISEEKVSSIFGSGKASFTAKNENCYLVTQESNGYALIKDG